MTDDEPLPLTGGSDLPRRPRFRTAGDPDGATFGIGGDTWNAIVGLRKTGKTVTRAGFQILVDGAMVTWDQLHWLARHAPEPKTEAASDGGKGKARRRRERDKRPAERLLWDAGQRRRGAVRGPFT